MSETATMTVATVALRVSGLVLATAASALVEALATTRLSLQSRRALEELGTTTPTTINAIEPLNLTASAVPPAVERVPAQEARLVRELASVAPLAVADTRGLQQELRARPLAEWPELIRRQHQQIFHRTLTDAVVRACRRLEFQPKQLAEGRLLAEDRGGRALAVEIRPEGQVQAEVLGIADGSCHTVLDQFLEALKKEGVGIARIDSRRWTGGAPASETGRCWATQRARTPAPISSRTTSERRMKGNRERLRIKG
ncbi:MAG: hypothetical protein ACP5U2_17815 [Bryobacteraceae bacterium]